MSKRVVITGIGVVSPIGIGTKSFWDNLISCQMGGEVPAFKIGDFVPKSYRKATKVMARDIELAVVAADDAFKDAGIQSKAYTETPDIPTTRFGCNIGAGLINAELNELTSAMTTARSDENPNK